VAPLALVVLQFVVRETNAFTSVLWALGFLGALLVAKLPGLLSGYAAYYLVYVPVFAANLWLARMIGGGYARYLLANPGLIDVRELLATRRYEDHDVRPKELGLTSTVHALVTGLLHVVAMPLVFWALLAACGPVFCLQAFAGPSGAMGWTLYLVCGFACGSFLPLPLSGPSYWKPHLLWHGYDPHRVAGAGAFRFPPPFDRVGVRRAIYAAVLAANVFAVRLVYTASPPVVEPGFAGSVAGALWLASFLAPAFMPFVLVAATHGPLISDVYQAVAPAEDHSPNT
jgi:hypothetical protein